MNRLVNSVLCLACTLFFLFFEASFAQFGDFDGDSNLDCFDINMLTTAVAGGSQVPSFDLNGDGLISRQDVTEWLIVAGNHNIGAPYLMGDSNLSGQVDASDYGGEWDAFRFTRSDGWCSADFNADGFTDVSDSLILLSNIFTASGSVPGVGDGTELIPSSEGRFIYDPRTGNLFADLQSPMIGFVVPGVPAEEVYYSGLEIDAVTGTLWSERYFNGSQQVYGVRLFGDGMQGAHLVARYPSGLTGDDFGAVEYGSELTLIDLPGVLSAEIEIREVIPADANLDGYVDVSDFNLWNRHKFTDFASWGTGDFNNDGLVDVSDLNLWNANKFTSSPSPSSVPEPAGLIFPALVMGGFVRRKSLAKAF